jgi:hypothetical protein
MPREPTGRKLAASRWAFFVAIGKEAMSELLQEFVDSRGVDVRIDRQQGVIRGVKLLGLESRNRRRYLPEALVQAAALYEGAKVNVNHPKGHPQSGRDYQDRIGVVRGVAVREGAGLFGDLHFNPKHALAEQLLWDAEHAPENVGFSHNVLARTARHGEQTLVEAILQVQSVDLVADPATTRGLCEAADAADSSPEHEPAERPDLLELVREEVQSQLVAISERVEQLEAALENQRPAAASRAARPLSREQRLAEAVLLAPLDAAAFARAIS